MARYYSGKYTGPDDRRSREEADRSMLPSDRGIANMPQSALYVPWTGSPALTPINAPEGLNDTKEGIDQQIMEDSGLKKAPGGGTASETPAPVEAVSAPATPAPVKEALAAVDAAPPVATEKSAKEVAAKENIKNPSPF